MKKKCTKCGIEKPENLKHFYKQPDGKNGLAPSCKVCVLLSESVRHKANPEPKRKRSREWHEKNPEKRAGYNWKTYYGITHEQYAALLFSQNGVCLICARKNSGKRRLSVDHCHATGKIRGLLCALCNMALGAMRDSPSQLRKAAEYLENAKNQNKK